MTLETHNGRLAQLGCHWMRENQCKIGSDGGPGQGVREH